MALEFWRDLAVIWLSLLCFIGAMIPLAIFYFAVRGMHAVTNHARPLLHKAQSYSRLAREQTDAMSARVARPVAQASGQAARWQRVWAVLTNELSSAAGRGKTVQNEKRTVGR